MEAIVSFETVEHVEDDHGFVAELRRVIAEDGVLVLSTPNAQVTRPVDGVPRNPYHIREYQPHELERLLSTAFRDVSLLGQRTSASYGPCPFWEGSASGDAELRGAVRAAVWKAIVRLPPRVADLASRGLLRRSLYPSARDFSFTQGALEGAHVLVAICRP